MSLTFHDPESGLTRGHVTGQGGSLLLTRTGQGPGHGQGLGKLCREETLVRPEIFLLSGHIYKPSESESCLMQTICFWPIYFINIHTI